MISRNGNALIILYFLILLYYSSDVEYAKALMDQTGWTVGEGARERWRRKQAAAGTEEARRDEWTRYTTSFTHREHTEVRHDCSILVM